MRSDRSQHSPPSSPAQRFVSASCRALIVGVALACAAQGQSGRQARKRAEIPSAPAPTPSPEARKSAPEPAAKLSLLVLLDNTPAIQTSATAQQIMRQAFLQRLHESDALVISQETTPATRNEAARRARGEKDRLVIWLAVRVNGIDTDISGIRRPRPEEYHLEYGVYEPVTGKTRANGNVYLEPVRNIFRQPVVVDTPPCYPAVVNREFEYEFVFGAIETANRVMKSLYLPLPPVCGGY